VATIRGEISVFLSLILVCILSLFLGLVESARTAGARLYLEMAANSSMDSVMSQYNRNLWDMYHLLFLETESERAVEESFSSYLDFYLGQENLYPMKITDVEVCNVERMTDEAGIPLEREILSYVMYRLPDVAADLARIEASADQASEAGDFRELLTVYRTVGSRTKKLETYRYEIESCLKQLEATKKGLEDAVSEEREYPFRKKAEQFEKLVSELKESVRMYEKESQDMSVELVTMKTESGPGSENTTFNESLQQEIIAYEQVVGAAENQLRRYADMEDDLETSVGLILDAVDELDQEDANWDAAGEYVSLIIIPETTGIATPNQEKIRLLDQLEELFRGDLLDLVLENGSLVSKKSVRLNGVPSAKNKNNTQLDGEDVQSNVLEQFMTNEYCFLSFDSFQSRCERVLIPNQQALQYEQEYLLCGKASDRENLIETVEKLLMIRGAMNLSYLLRSPDSRKEVEAFTMAISGGSLPIQVILSFFILTLWAIGEAVWDVKLLMRGDSVPFFKSKSGWQLELDEFLGFQFLLEPEKTEAEGSDYQDYLRVLFFLMDRAERNYRIMDVIQWNVQSVQEDFLVNDCIAKIEVRSTIEERHLFLLQGTYSRTTKVNGSY